MITVSQVGDVEAIQHLQDSADKVVNIAQKDGRSNAEHEGEGSSGVVPAFPSETSEPCHAGSAVFGLTLAGQTRGLASPAPSLGLSLLEGPSGGASCADCITPAGSTVRVAGRASQVVVEVVAVLAD